VNAQVSFEPSSGVTLSGGNICKVDKIGAGWNWYIYWGVDIAPGVNLDITKVKVVVKADNEGEFRTEESLASIMEKAIYVDPVPGKDIPWIKFMSESPEINKEFELHVVFEGIQSMEVTITDPEGNNQPLNPCQTTESYYSYRYTPTEAGTYTITAVANGDPAKKMTRTFAIQWKGLGSDSYNQQIQKIAEEKGAKEAFNQIIVDVDKYGSELNDFDSDNVAKFNTLVSSIVKQVGSVDKVMHFFRNKLNSAPKSLDEMIDFISNNPNKKWTMLDPEKAAYHMNGTNGEFNLKFVSPDGHFEAIYNSITVNL
jgi:hypothetical protein